MKFSRERSLVAAIGFVIVAWLLSGCVPDTDTTPLSSSHFSTRTPFCTTVASSPTVIRPLSTRTPVPTMTPSPTPAPTATRTPVLHPTLEAEQMEAFITEMLADNGGCELPCWWGVTPGETSWETVRQYFSEQGIQVLEDGTLALRYQSGQYQGQWTYTDLIEVNIHQDEDIVQRIEVQNSQYQSPLQERFTSLWQRYALQPLLSRHGVPTRVYLNLTTGAPCVGSGNFPSYDMWVVYDDQGIAILYSGLLLYDHDSWWVCPVFGQSRRIHISLWSAADEVAPPDFATGVYDPSGEFSVYGFLSELTEMDTQTFYDIFSQVEPQTCVEIPRTSYYGEETVLPDSPGLSPDEESALLVDMLLNSRCALPCWWGVTPGLTSWADAQQMFLSYGKSVSREWEDEYWGTRHRVSLMGRQGTYPFDYIVEHLFYEQAGVVTLIGIYGHTLGWPADEWPQPRYFTQDWRQYFPDQIMTRYGKPTQILLHYWAEDSAPYSIGVVYQDQGILIEYMGISYGEYTEGNYYPDNVIIDVGTRHFTDINIWLRSTMSEANMADVFRRFGGGYLGLLHFGSTPTLEEATGMSLDEFYQVFQNPEADMRLRAHAELGDQYP